MKLKDEIHARLQESFTPTHLDVINESHLHAGHAGDDGSGESHWRVVIVADAFADLSRLARHRAVHAALGKKVMTTLHALALDIKAP